MQREHRENILIQRAAAELKTAGAREIYVFGSAAKGTGDAAADLDLAVSGLPRPFSIAWCAGQRFDWPFGGFDRLGSQHTITRYLRTENELVRVG